MSYLHTVKEKKHCREENNMDASNMDYGQHDIILVLQKHKDVQRDRIRNARRISPVQFLRDRELGIRGTNERIVRQGVTIEYDSIHYWPYYARQQVYQRLLDECKSEEEEDYNPYMNFDLCLSEEENYSNMCGYRAFIRHRQMYLCERYEKSKMYYYSERIFGKIHDSSNYFIAIPAGVGRCVELFVMKNCYRFNDRDDYSTFINEHYKVQDTERYCRLCKRVACKCSFEDCDVICEA